MGKAQRNLKDPLFNYAEQIAGASEDILDDLFEGSFEGSIQRGLRTRIDNHFEETNNAILAMAMRIYDLEVILRDSVDSIGATVDESREQIDEMPSSIFGSSLSENKDLSVSKDATKYGW